VIAGALDALRGAPMMHAEAIRKRKNFFLLAADIASDCTRRGTDFLESVRDRLRLTGIGSSEASAAWSVRCGGWHVGYRSSAIHGLLTARRRVPAVQASHAAEAANAPPASALSCAGCSAHSWATQRGHRARDPGDRCWLIGRKHCAPVGRQAAKEKTAFSS